MFFSEKNISLLKVSDCV